MTNEALFCVKYLYQLGFFPKDKQEIEQLLTKKDIPNYKFVEIPKGDFFTDLAAALRNLWPVGEKDGKYPWRDSVPNISTRLQTLWKQRDLSKYTLDDCLVAARKYLSQFESNVKYMRTLKYFIFRQNKIVEKNGRIRYTFESLFADMLEGLSTLEKQSDWTVLEESVEFQPLEQGVLV